MMIADEEASGTAEWSMGARSFQTALASGTWTAGRMAYLDDPADMSSEKSVEAGAQPGRGWRRQVVEL